MYHFKKHFIHSHLFLTTYGAGRWDACPLLEWVPEVLSVCPSPIARE